MEVSYFLYNREKINRFGYTVDVQIGTCIFRVTRCIVVSLVNETVMIQENHYIKTTRKKKNGHFVKQNFVDHKNENIANFRLVPVEMV